MKMLTIGTKSQANKVLVNSLFQPVNGHTLTVTKFDSAKYDPSKSFIGHEVQAPDDIFAVYQIRKSDSYGKYMQLMCICSD